MTTRPHMATRTKIVPSRRAKAAWPLSTVLWTFVALVVPINYSLPSMVRAVWFITIMGLILVQVLVSRLARPLYPAIWALAGFASVVAILTATKAVAIEDNLFVGVQLVALLGFGVFALTADAVLDTKFVQRLSVAFLIGQSISSVVAVLQLLLGKSTLVPAAVNGRASGLSEHPNTLGLTAGVAILITLNFLFVTRKFRILVLAGLTVNILALVASGSLSSMIAFAVGFVVLIICVRYHLVQMALGGIAFAMVLWLASSFTGVVSYLPSLSERYKQVTGQTTSVSSWDLRKRTLDFAWSRISEEPMFGNGLSAQASGTFDGTTLVHNTVLRAWYQGGILLAFAFAVIAVAVVVVAIRAMIRKEFGGEASVIITVFVYAFMSPMLEQRHYWLIVLVAWASISAALLNRSRSGWTATPSHLGTPVRDGDVNSSVA